jgi:hypothetical protein
MPNKLIALGAAAALTAGLSSAAMAQYYCAPGYTYHAGVCQPVTPLGYSNPVSGAVSGEAAGAQRGYQTGGPIGAVVGGALGTAGGVITGTGNMLAGAAPPPSCAPGYHLYRGYCYANP